jgi:hypothetical protein
MASSIFGAQMMAGGWFAALAAEEVTFVGDGTPAFDPSATLRLGTSTSSPISAKATHGVGNDYVFV